MLPYLLATHPATSTATLQLLVNTPGIPGGAVGAALTHPNMPVDMPVPSHVHLSGHAAHTVLGSERTTAERRAQIIAAVHPMAIMGHLERFTDLTANEIAAIAPTSRRNNPLLALAAANPNTSTTHREDALRALAATAPRTTHVAPFALFIAVLTHGHDLAPAFLAKLGKRTASHGDAHTAAYFAGTSTRTAIDIAMDHPDAVVDDLVNRCYSTDLTTRALRDGRPVDMLRARNRARNLAHNRNDTEGLRLLDAHQLDPDELALQLLATATDPTRDLADEPYDPDDPADDEAPYVDLADSLTNIALSAGTLRTIVETLTVPPPPHTGLGDPGHVLRYAAAHPATPRDLLPRIAEVIRYVPAPLPRAGMETRQATAAIAAGVVAGDRHPALRIPTPAFARRHDDRKHTVETRHLRAAAEGHPGWPLSPLAAQALITLEPTFSGTLGELLDTATAITT